MLSCWPLLAPPGSSWRLLWLHLAPLGAGPRWPTLRALMSASIWASCGLASLGFLAFPGLSWLPGAFWAFQGFPSPQQKGNIKNKQKSDYIFPGIFFVFAFLNQNTTSATNAENSLGIPETSRESLGLPGNLWESLRLLGVPGTSREPLGMLGNPWESLGLPAISWESL